MIVIYFDEETRRKVLDKDSSTSILCDVAILDASEKLKLVAACRDNKYYLVGNTNTVLMHVEEGFCILCDYMVYEKVLPILMKNAHYAVYQSAGRDWIKNSATGQLIGYDIKEFLTGQSGRPQGMTLDHMAETFNEMEKNKQFSTDNINEGSHRIQVKISSEDDLNIFINQIIENDGKPGGIFIK